MPSSAWKDRVRSVSSRGPSLVVRCLGCRYPTRIGRLARKTRLLNDHGGTVAGLAQALSRHGTALSQGCQKPCCLATYRCSLEPSTRAGACALRATSPLEG